MQRSASYSSQGGHGRDRSTTPLPPWEQRNMSRVPYMSRNTQPWSEAARQTLQPSWAANERDEPMPSQSSGYGTAQRSLDCAYSMPHHSGEASAMPMSPPPFTAARPQPPLPVPTPRQSPTTSQPSTSSSCSPSYVGLPPTPPPDFVSLSRSSTTKSVIISSPGTSPRLPQHTIPALPGTMSARDSVVPSHKPSPRPKREESVKKEKPETKPLGKRFKLAIKDIFKREPIDESQFEHISDRHWTDE